jgi:imidazolonepropionase
VSDLIIKNVGQFFGKGPAPYRAEAISEIDTVEAEAVLIENGAISAFGGFEKLTKGNPNVEVADAGSRLVTPGFVDCHTHTVFGGNRADEFVMRTRGASYLEIFEAGGGILSSLRATRKATEDELYESARKRLEVMTAHGTTTVEVKSGYGLDTETELKQLRVAKKLAVDLPLEIVPTFIGAHAIPPEYKNGRDAYVSLVCDEMIPAVVEEDLAEYCDVFCDRGAFTLEETEWVLKAAVDAGLKLRIHADEFESLGAVQLAVELGAASVDHLAVITDEDIKTLAESDTVATLLPGTTIYLGSGHFAPARKMLETGCIVAVASDLNPGSCTAASVRTVLSPAAVNLGMTPAELVHGCTANAAFSLGRADTVGTLEVGKKADLCIWDAADVNDLVYRWADPRAHVVIKEGRIIYRDEIRIG